MIVSRSALNRLTIGNAALLWARWQMQRSGLSQMFKDRPQDAIEPQNYDLWNLYSSVRKLRPRIVLEFGVGCSSYVLAAAVRRNGTGHVVTVDANMHWLDVTQRQFPAQLRDCITFIHSPLEIVQYPDAICSRYARLPDVSPDFVYLDGPSGSDIPGWPVGRAVCADDPVQLEPRFSPGFRMVVDGRLENVAFLERHLKRDYRVRQDGFFKLTTFDLRT